MLLTAQRTTARALSESWTKFCPVISNLHLSHGLFFDLSLDPSPTHTHTGAGVGDDDKPNTSWLSKCTHPKCILKHSIDEDTKCSKCGGGAHTVCLVDKMCQKCKPPPVDPSPAQGAEYTPANAPDAVLTPANAPDAVPPSGAAPEQHDPTPQHDPQTRPPSTTRPTNTTLPPSSTTQDQPVQDPPASKQHDPAPKQHPPASNDQTTGDDELDVTLSPDPTWENTVPGGLVKRAWGMKHPAGDAAT
jgi:hypothetical protein